MYFENDTTLCQRPIADFYIDTAAETGFTLLAGSYFQAVTGISFNGSQSPSLKTGYL